ncbi:MAG: acyl-ACP--UDP-N-acetylglucosamine O-acyltransferase [Bacteroidales bacterium]
MPTNIPDTLDRLCFRYPASFVDALLEHEPGRRLVAQKNVTVSEDYFQGHFPGAPVMPGVLMIETFVQAAAVLLLEDGGRPRRARVALRGVDEAKFRRQVVPGDQVRVEVSRLTGRAPLERVQAVASIDGQLVAEARLLLVVVPDRVHVDPSAHVHPAAVIEDGTAIGPNVTIGEHVRVGRDCEIGASSVVDGWVEIGNRNRISPFVSIGLPPQDLKYRGEPTRVAIGDDNLVREFVTIHRGTAGGGGVTTIGHRNLFMAYSHVAHDCHVGSDIIFGNGATLGGHVHVEDFATVSAMSGVHQFCRVGRHAFIGAASAVTKDALPFARTVGNRARIYGLNVIGLVRRGFTAEVVGKLRRAYRYLLVSKLTMSKALAAIEADSSLDCDEVRYLVEFIRTSPRGVVLRRASHHGGSDEE